MGPPFLSLVDYLMHKAPYKSKSAYEAHVPEVIRTAFLKEVKATHSADDAPQKLADAWRSFIASGRAEDIAEAGFGNLI